MKLPIIAALMALLPMASRAQQIPTIDQVGPKAMPAEIAPINAPFAMPQLQRPDFGPRRATVKLKKGRMATTDLQKAIDRMARLGGGTVVVPAGKWATGRITLKSGVCLDIPKGAELAFSGNIKDYQPEVFTRDEGMELYSLGAYIYANGAHKIGITGGGVISGAPTTCEIYTANQSNFTVDPEQLIDKTPLEQRHYNGIDTREVFLPKTIAPINCTNVLIEGVTLRQCLYWNVVPQYCDSVIIRGVTVESYGHGRTDGIDIESSRNVLIEYTTLTCGDDAFTIKAGRGLDGITVNRPTENVVIRYCLALTSIGGIAFGSETAGVIRDVYAHDCVLDGARVGLSFKTRRPRGGGGENLYMERIRIKTPGSAIKFDMLGSAKYVGGQSARKAMPRNELTPYYRNVSIRDIIVEQANSFLNVVGIPESPALNITISNVKSTSKQLIALHDVSNLLLRNAELTTTEGNKIDISDGRNITFDNVSIQTPNGHVDVEKSGELTENLRLNLN